MDLNPEHIPEGLQASVCNITSAVCIPFSVSSTLPVIHLIAFYIIWSFFTCTFWTETIILFHWVQYNVNKTTLI